MKYPDERQSAVTAADNKSGVTVLLVDDSNTVRRSARGFLEAEGYVVFTAADGFEALANVVEHRPSLVFIDIVMPRLDGYQTCALIKNNADFRRIPVVMLSSGDGSFDRARAQVVGSDAHLAKPFTAQSLADAVRWYTGTSCAGSKSTARMSNAPVHPPETSDA